MRRHTSGIWRSGDRFHAQCAQCGWISRRSYPTTEAAEAAAKRHVKTATAEDVEVNRILYGPKPH